MAAGLAAALGIGNSVRGCRKEEFCFGAGRRGGEERWCLGFVFVAGWSIGVVATPQSLVRCFC